MLFESRFISEVWSSAVSFGARSPGLDVAAEWLPLLSKVETGFCCLLYEESLEDRICELFDVGASAIMTQQWNVQRAVACTLLQYIVVVHMSGCLVASACVPRPGRPGSNPYLTISKISRTETTVRNLTRYKDTTQGSKSS